MLQHKSVRRNRSRITARLRRFLFSLSVRDAMLAFLFTFSEIFGIPSPFALTLIAVQGQAGESPMAAMIGLCAAFGVRFLWKLPVDIWPLVGGLVLALGRAFYFGRQDRSVFVWCGGALLPRMLFGFIFASPAEGLLALASLIMGMVAIPAFRQVLNLLRTPQDSMGWDDKLCLGLFFGLLLCALGYFHVFSVNLGFTAACLLCLCLSCASGADAAALAGLLCAAVLSLCGHGLFPILSFTTAGLSAGLTRSLQSRFKTSLIFTLVYLLSAVVAAPAHMLYNTLPCLAACIGFAFVSPGQLSRLNALASQIKPPPQPLENAFASEMLRQWEDAIAEMARSLPQIDESDTPLWHFLKTSLCEGCAQLTDCWTEEREAAVPHQLWEAAQEDDAALHDWAAAAECSCPRLSQMRQIVEQIYAQHSHHQAEVNRAHLEQAMIRTHLEAMAHAARRLSAISQGESLSDLKNAARLERVLKETGFPARLLYARRPGGRLQCLLESETPAFTRWQPQRLISDLWNCGGLSMEITHLERSRMLLEETPSFRLETGSATLGMEEDNGDGLLCMRLPGGRCLLALSDGMGHGTAAARQSRETLNLLRLCLLAGYTRSQAITAVNGMMLSATGGSVFSTMDLWTIDLWSGLAQADKLGACQSILWRSDKPRFIEGAALPLGILEEVTPQSCQFRLGDNDLLLLFSDGIADAFPTPEDLASAVARSVYQDPQRTADALLRFALISAGGIPKDDMTVLAARMTQWSAPARTHHAPPV